MSEREQEFGPYAKRFRVRVSHGHETLVDLTYRSLPVATTTFQREVARRLTESNITVVLTLDRADPEIGMNAGTTLAIRQSPALYVEFFAPYYRLLAETL